MYTLFEDNSERYWHGDEDGVGSWSRNPFFQWSTDNVQVAFSLAETLANKGYTVTVCGSGGVEVRTFLSREDY